jgi:zinc/manganese transport system ATP-binding protein
LPIVEEPVLSLRDATLRFADRTLWSGLDLDVHPGEFIAVLGANGSGKTSLLKVILGKN